MNKEIKISDYRIQIETEDYLVYRIYYFGITTGILEYKDTVVGRLRDVFIEINRYALNAEPVEKDYKFSDIHDLADALYSQEEIRKG